MRFAQKNNMNLQRPLYTAIYEEFGDVKKRPELFEQFMNNYKKASIDRKKTKYIEQI